MNAMHGGGCLKISLAGCGLLLLLICGCGFVATLSFRRAMPEPLPPVEVVGACPADEVRAFFDGFDERMELAFAPLAALNESDDDDLAAALMTVDVSELEAARDRLAAEPVPECARAVVEAEAALLDDGIEILVDVQDCLGEGEGASPLCLPRALFALTTRMPGHGERLSAAYEAVADEAGIEVPDELKFESEGGPRFEIDTGSGGFEFNP